MDLRDNRLNGLAATAGVMAMAGLLGLLSACASGSGPEDAYKQLTRVDQGKPYLGMSKAEVLTCAGQPRSRIPAGPSAETLVYHYSGAGPVPQSADADSGGKKKVSSPFGGKKKSKGPNAECSASLTFEKDVLVRVSYAHMNVRSPYEWQGEKTEAAQEKMRNEGVPTCAFSLPRCRR
ncbi:MAG TPA: hypothetical protein VMW57_03755 [Methyloceanibacter sp.]|nr:hypothetical protein [Methyloceanibacter sp.]